MAVSTETSSLLSELESAVKNGSKDKRVETLRRVTDLFLSDADRYNEEQIHVFDTILEQLIDRIETKARAELSSRMAPITNAPQEVIRKLAFDEELSVAAPVLQLSPRLTSADLVAVARRMGQGHLMAISRRQGIDEAVTDVLIDRGDREVLTSLIGNRGAQFSISGFSTMVRRAENDDVLTERLGMRLDLPIRLLKELLSRATAAVRDRLIAVTSGGSGRDIQKILQGITNDVLSDEENVRDYDKAAAIIDEMKRHGALSDAAVREFALHKQTAEVTVAIAVLAQAPRDLIVSLMDNSRIDAILIPCKSAGLAWPTVRAVLQTHHAGMLLGDKELDLSFKEYCKLSRETADRVLRFWQVRKSVSGQAGPQPIDAA